MRTKKKGALHSSSVAFIVLFDLRISVTRPGTVPAFVQYYVVGAGLWLHQLTYLYPHGLREVQVALFHSEPLCVC